MPDTIPVAQLRAFVERIERIEADIKDLNGDKSEVYKELRGCGFDVKAVRAVVAKRKLDTADREERDAMFDLYWSALNGTGTEDATRVHVHGASYSEAKGIDRDARRKQRMSESMDDAKALSAEAAALGLIDPAAHAETVRLSDAIANKYGAGVIDPGTGELTDNQENQHDADSGQHVGRADNEQRDAARVSSAYGRGKGDNEGAQGQGPRAAGTDRGGGPVAGTLDREDQDGRSRHVGGEARHAVAAQDDVGATASSTHSEMDRATEGSFETGSEAAENARKAIPARPEDGSVSHAGAGEIPATNSASPAAIPLGAANSAGEAPSSSPASPARHSDDDIPAFIKQDKPDCLKLKDGHCRLSFATSALCAECNQRRAMARALA